MRERDKQLLADHYLDFYQIAFSILRNPADAEDAVHDALVKTMSQPMLKDPYRYCSTIVRNNSVKLLQKCAYSLPHSLPRSLPDDPFAEDDPTETRIQQLWKLKDQLPPRMREILDLYYVKGYSREQIAQHTSLTLSTVNKIFYTGHYKLKQQLLTLEQHENDMTDNK